VTPSIPSVIHIYGHPIKVIFTSLTDEGLNGDFDYKTKVIRISTDDGPEVQFDTFIHEITHAGLELSGICYLLKGGKEEAVVRVVENSLSLAVKELIQYTLEKRDGST